MYPSETNQQIFTLSALLKKPALKTCITRHRSIYPAHNFFIAIFSFPFFTTLMNLSITKSSYQTPIF
jgi:hypothetical protein